MKKTNVVDSSKKRLRVQIDLTRQPKLFKAICKAAKAQKMTNAGFVCTAVLNSL